MRVLLFLYLFLIPVCCSPKLTNSHSKNNETQLYDCHVHLMSPGLISDWKAIGIPFGRTEANYFNIDTILSNVGATKIDLIGMGYVYENPEYFQGENPKEKLQEENDYLLETTSKYPSKVRPFITVNPLRDYSNDEIERCFQSNKGIGLKLHFNASQVYLTEPEHLEKVKSIFEKASELQLPILLHFDNWHPKFGKDDLALLVDSVLANLRPIKINMAHFGTSGGFSDKTKAFIVAYEKLRDKISERHTIYLDISAVALDKNSEGMNKLSDEEFKILNTYIHKIGIKHILFGTDYPLYNASKYEEILLQKVGLNKKEIQIIQTNSKKWMNE
ncbi:amidohydrolase family protein [bacterium]|nr:amidohydrolase family protein [bacterium]